MCLAGVAAQAQTQTTQPMESVAAIYRQPNSLTIGLVGSSYDSGELLLHPSQFPPFTLTFAAIGAVAYDPTEDVLPLLVQLVEGTENYASYGQWVSQPLGERIVHGVFATGSRNGYTAPPDAPALKFYWRKARYFYADTPFTRVQFPLGGEGEAQVCIAVYWKTAYGAPSLLEVFDVQHVATVNQYYDVNNGTGTVTHLQLVAPNGLPAATGTANFEFYAPGATQVVGTFSGIAGISGTDKARHYVGSFGAQLLDNARCQ
jgi:hypothetical protein